MREELALLDPACGGSGVRMASNAAAVPVVNQKSAAGAGSGALDLVGLPALMDVSSGSPEITIGLLDGPVAGDHHDLTLERIRGVSGGTSAWCSSPGRAACLHGTFTAGILCAKRGSAAPAICPDCTLLIRPIFAETGAGQMPSATLQELATAIVETVRAGARVLNLSLALLQPSGKGEREIKQALDYAVSRGVVVVVAAGNQGAVGSSVITRHPWVIPVVACDLHGRPMGISNLGHSIGRRGLMAPGENITSLGAEGKPVTSGGTSVAAPFVTATIALLWSVFPAARADDVRFAVTQAARRPRALVPPLLDAWAAYQSMATAQGRR